MLVETCPKYLRRHKIPCPKGFFNLAEKGIVRTRSWKLESSKSRLETRHSLLQWGDSSLEAGDAPSPGVFGVRMDTLLEHPLVKHWWLGYTWGGWVTFFDLCCTREGGLDEQVLGKLWNWNAKNREHPWFLELDSKGCTELAERAHRETRLGSRQQKVTKATRNQWEENRFNSVQGKGWWKREPRAALWRRKQLGEKGWVIKWVWMEWS